MKERVVGIALLVIILISCTSTPTQTPTALPTKPPTTTPSASPTATSTRKPTIGPTRTRKPSQTVWRGDLHMHTDCSDGENSYAEMVQKALALRLDFIAITDHMGFGEGKCVEEMLTRCQAETRLLCIPGAELTQISNHVVALGIYQRIGIWQDMKSLVEEIHDQGGLAVAAHPYSKNYPIPEEALLHSGFDAMECRQGATEQDVRQRQLSAQYHIPCLYDSDAHNIRLLGEVSNVCRMPINSLEDLKAALKTNQCKQN